MPSKADILALEQHTGKRQIAARRLFNAAQLRVKPARAVGQGKTRRAGAPTCPCKRPEKCVCTT